MANVIRAVEWAIPDETGVPSSINAWPIVNSFALKKISIPRMIYFELIALKQNTGRIFRFPSKTTENVKKVAFEVIHVQVRNH